MREGLVKLTLSIYVSEKAQGKMLMLKGASKAPPLLSTITPPSLLPLTRLVRPGGGGGGPLGVALGPTTVAYKKRRHSKLELPAL